MTVTDMSAARLEGVWARHAVAHAEALRAADPSWGTTWFELADGLVVLQGAGLYVNRALALGLTADVGATELDELVQRSRSVGVPAAVDVVPDTSRRLRELLGARGATPTGFVTVMTMALDAAGDHGSDTGGQARNDVVVRPVGSDDVRLWQQLTAGGWGHESLDRRRASDAYAAAAFATEGETLVIATDREDGRPLGCASLAVREGVATLGGMSTLPAERGRGVQRALVADRLRRARLAGATIATCSAVVGGASERNLLRLGFVPAYAKSTLTIALP